MGLEIGLCPPGNLQSLWKNLHCPSKLLPVTELVQSLKIAAVVHSLHGGCQFMCKHLQVVEHEEHSLSK